MRGVMRSPSWSEVCRERCASYIRQINNGDATIEWAFYNLSCSYRPRLFRERTAKLLRRAIRSGRVHEHENAVVEWNKERKEVFERRPMYL